MYIRFDHFHVSTEKVIGIFQTIILRQDKTFEISNDIYTYILAICKHIDKAQ